MRILLLALTLSLSVASFATDQKGYYLGKGTAIIDGNETDRAGDRINFAAMEAYFGYKWRGFLGIEGRLGTGLVDEDISVLNEDTGQIEIATTNVDYYPSLYYRAETSNVVAKTYGLLGVSYVSYSREFQDGTIQTVKKSGLSYGGGIGFVMKENININFEYRSIIDTDAVTLTGANVSLDYRF